MTEYFMSLFALFVEGGGVTSRQIIASTTDEEYTAYEYKEGTFVVHEDDKGKHWVLLFEDFDTAEHVAKDYFEATGDHAHPKMTMASSLDYEQNIRLYRLDGSWQDVDRQHYLANAS
ncbi:hypothetical protein UFOVP704_10 [uncultured Caudovirales phage]|uniref:Uncharacterized protein n=1 Tax=uncultured Caudovirales phage TaxID=2100421 RepID=A0A6J5NFP7_9CAUD|nr:hypothetical protein UFOVP704_10 [uncultured Caudovirales phage]